MMPHTTSFGRALARVLPLGLLAAGLLLPKVAPAAPAATGVPVPGKPQYAGLDPEAAAKAMILPPGFHATLFAGEPDVKQPIAFAQDHRGRLWVAEAYTYPKRAAEGQGKDRILVFEDTNGDGRFDKRTVFMEGLNLISGLEVGFGGVWVGAAPNLVFIPIKDGDSPKPAGPPQILLDGWGYEDTHETLNTFTWGPDGWLYGCHGVFTHSNVGKPGTPAADRLNITAAVWRYHPTRHVLERFAEGTSNPWGVDFDAHGQCIIEACVIPHLFHMVQGGRFERQGGQHVNPYIFEDIKTIADHRHYLGNQWNDADRLNSDALGGGHAHAGLLVYQGDSWPEAYRGRFFMNNIHGSRINMDVPERQGSGFVGHHGPDFINFNDSWSQVLNLQTAPDGSVYLIDWYDQNQCHHNDPNGHDRSNGRIFKIVYGTPKTVRVNLEKLTSAELVQLTRHPNEWQVRHARRALQERGPDPAVHRALTQILDTDPNPEHQLNALWALHVTGGLTEEIARRQLHARDEYVRAWTLQLLGESGTVPNGMLSGMEALAQGDPSPVVRLYLASLLQRLPPGQRWDTVAALIAHGEDAHDHNLPLMYWYAAEPLAALDTPRALALAETAATPHFRAFTVRRAAALGTPAAFAAITEALVRAGTENVRRELLDALALALQGRRSVPLPAGWEAAATKLTAGANATLRARVEALSLKFGQAGAREALQTTLRDAQADGAARQIALDALLAARDRSLVPVLQSLLPDTQFQGAALRALAAFDEPAIPGAILAAYPALGAPARRDALSTLVSRVAFAQPLLTAIGEGTVPARDLTADLVRQLRGLKNPAVEQAVAKVWGVARDSSADKKAEIAKFKEIYRTGANLPESAPLGRALFVRTCQQCHTLFGTGGKVGPDLTGSNRGDLDYLLENILDPNAVIPNDYRASNLETKDGRSITGIVTKQDAQSVTVVTANEVLVLPRGDLASLQLSALSMMPEGLLQALTPQEVHDLVFYLTRPTQSALPEAK